MMRKLQLLFVLLLLPLLTWAQTQVTAADVLAKINRGEAVSYQNAVITGDLDMTRLQNMQLKKESDSDYSTKEYVSTVTAPLTFTNCTFRGNVLAYYNPNSGLNIMNKSNEVYNTNFEREVRFENCVFEQTTAFKYSEFKQNVSFAGSQFNNEALFKYSKFATPVNFSKAKFKDGAVFKYVTFPKEANFAAATFGQEADFKYTKFTAGANFENAEFNGLANFKYTKFSDPVQLRGVAFKGSDDFKYTEVNNKKATLSVLMDRSK